MRSGVALPEPPKEIHNVNRLCVCERVCVSVCVCVCVCAPLSPTGHPDWYRRTPVDVVLDSDGSTLAAEVGKGVGRCSDCPSPFHPFPVPPPPSTLCGSL